MISKRHCWFLYQYLVVCESLARVLSVELSKRTNIFNGNHED